VSERGEVVWVFVMYMVLLIMLRCLCFDFSL